MITISLSRPNGITLPPGNIGCSCSALLIRFARLKARTFSAVVFEMIFAAPYCWVVQCLTTLTLEHPPLPIVLPNCHGPMCVFRRRPVLDALVDAFEISESRFVFRCSSFATAETRLLSGDADRRWWT